MAKRVDPRQGYLISDGAYHCRICGRGLSNPESIRAGIGPICASKMGGGAQPEAPGGFEDHEVYSPQPITEGLTFSRIEKHPGAREALLVTNVPHVVVSHSPTGYEWGYGGSGPADLALNIAEALLRDAGVEDRRVQCFNSTSCFAAAWAIHQNIKWRFVASMPQAGGRIDYVDLARAASAFLLEHVRPDVAVTLLERALEVEEGGLAMDVLRIDLTVAKAAARATEAEREALLAERAQLEAEQEREALLGSLGGNEPPEEAYRLEEAIQTIEDEAQWAQGKLDLDMGA